MNRKQEEDTVQINFRLKPSEKAKIERLAKKCGLSVTEYLTERALGYEPRTVLPDDFYGLQNDICRLANRLHGGGTPETEAAVLELLVRIQSELMLPGKQSTDQIAREVLSGPPKSRKTFWGEEEQRSE